MSTWVGLALALALGHNGTNGLDPATLVLFRNAAGQFEVEQGARDFQLWLAQDPVERASTMGYFVACAFDDKTEIKVGQYTWRGVFGLAQSSLMGISAGKPGRLPLRPDEGKWVSACLMAFVNMRGWHEYISLRGNPPGAASSKFTPTPAERWTMGHPEGVFLADLLNFNYDPVGQPSLSPRSPTSADLEKSYTLSLNLPQNHPGDWAPPNAAVGRTLDYDLETKVKVKGLGDVAIRIARRIGESCATKHKAGGTASPDPDYARDAICVTDGPPRPSVVDCDQAGAAQTLRPLFVHAPRVVNLTPLRAADPALTMQAVGGPATMKECPLPRPSHRCVGPFADVSVISCPRDVQSPAPKARFLKLGKDQEVVALLRFVHTNEPVDLVKQVKEEGSLDVKYTAIVRYRSASAATAPVQVIDENGLWRDAGKIWPSTGGAFQWLQVFPVYPLKDDEHSGGQKALKIRITGKDDKTPLDLDVAGFVPGPPWCHAGEGSFMDVCWGEPCRGEPLRLHAARAPRPRPPGPK